jgi:uncharacterized membrane protein YgdD (TMEM256/DUF423 family)
MNATTALRLAAIFGFLGVALGAFGAHGLEKGLIANGHLDDWKTAVLYHLVHAAVLVAISLGAKVPRAAWWLFASGILIFSGTLYVLSAMNMNWLGRITPLGGLALLGGWLALAVSKR